MKKRQFKNLTDGQVFFRSREGEANPSLFRKEEGRMATCIVVGHGKDDELGEHEFDDRFGLLAVCVLKFNTWFDTFLREKQLPEVVNWDLTDNQGMNHFIGSAVVIEAIHNCPAKEQAGIKDMIVRIDFVDGDVNDYFKHLAGALINA